MLVAAGVIVQVVQAVVIYNQGQTISELKNENKNNSEEFDAKIKKMEREKNAEIDTMKADRQEIIAMNKAQIDAMEADRQASIKKAEADKIRIQELIKANEKAIEKSEAINEKLDAILKLPGVQVAIKSWQEAGDMYLSNYNEASTVKNSHQESYGETASTSESDIELIDDPSSEINELTLSNCNQMSK